MKRGAHGCRSHLSSLGLNGGGRVDLPFKGVGLWDTGGKQVTSYLFLLSLFGPNSLLVPPTPVAHPLSTVGLHTAPPAMSSTGNYATTLQAGAAPQATAQQDNRLATLTANISKQHPVMPALPRWTVQPRCRHPAKAPLHRSGRQLVGARDNGPEFQPGQNPPSGRTGTGTSGWTGTTSPDWQWPVAQWSTWGGHSTQPQQQWQQGWSTQPQDDAPPKDSHHGRSAPDYSLTQWHTYTMTAHPDFQRDTSRSVRHGARPLAKGEHPGAQHAEMRHAPKCSGDPALQIRHSPIQPIHR